MNTDFFNDFFSFFGKKQVFTKEDHLETLYKRQANQKIPIYLSIFTRIGVVLFLIFLYKYLFDDSFTFTHLCTYFVLSIVILYRFVIDTKKHKKESLFIIEYLVRLKAYCG